MLERELYHLLSERSVLDPSEPLGEHICLHGPYLYIVRVVGERLVVPLLSQQNIPLESSEGEKIGVRQIVLCLRNTQISRLTDLPLRSYIGLNSMGSHLEHHLPVRHASFLHLARLVVGI